MSIKKAVLAATLAVSMTSAPVFAQAASPAPAAAQVSRSAANMSDESELRGGFIIPLIAVLAVILGIWAAVGGDDNDRPTSP